MIVAPIHFLKVLKHRIFLSSERAKYVNRLVCIAPYLPKTFNGRIPGTKVEFRLRGRTSDFEVFEDVFIENCYELPSINFSPKTIVDAGANIGLASIFFANRWNEAQIIALEPESSNFEILQRNTASLHSVTLLYAALWNKKTRLSISNPRAASWAFIVADTNASQTATPVEALGVQDILEKYDLLEIDILKLDIEGAEKHVFSGPTEWLDKVKILIVELHDNLEVGCASNFYRATAKYNFIEYRKGENVIMIKEQFILK